MTDRDRTVLVVDDDLDFRTQLKVQLEEAGYKVVEADGRQAALEAFDEHRPDAALVDLMMEHVDAGLTLCYEIKQRDASVPVVLVTGVESETGIAFDAATDEERRWVKADAVLAKPVRFEQLEREINRLLKG